MLVAFEATHGICASDTPCTIAGIGNALTPKMLYLFITHACTPPFLGHNAGNAGAGEVEGRATQAVGGDENKDKGVDVCLARVHPAKRPKLSCLKKAPLLGSDPVRAQLALVSDTRGALQKFPGHHHAEGIPFCILEH